MRRDVPYRMLLIPSFTVSAIASLPVCGTQIQRNSDVALLRSYILSVNRGHSDIIRGRYQDSREFEISAISDML